MTGDLREAADNRVTEVVDASPMTAPKPAFRRGIVISAVAGAFMAAIGAVGTDAVPLGARLAYWLPVMITGSTLGTGIAFGVQGWGRLRHNLIAEGALVTLLIALPLTIVVVGANQMAFGSDAPNARTLAFTFGVVLMVSAIMTAVNYATSEAAALRRFQDRMRPPPDLQATPGPRSSPTLAPAGSALSPPRILARLPLRLRGARLLALEAEDHYLRVHTDAGSDLILLRLADAIAEADDLPGARCHRSWWVARDAVMAVNRTGGRIILDIAPMAAAATIKVPVSRSYVGELRAAGWLD